MNTLVATVSAYVAVGLLLVGGLTHSANPRTFRSFVSRQALWPAWLAAPVVAVVITVELTLGVGGIAVLAFRGSLSLAESGAAAVLIATGGVYLAFTSYSVALLLRRPGAPCGCSHADSPVNMWVPVRSATIAVASLASATASDRVLPASTATPFLVAALAATGYVVLLWSLPVALDDPDRYERGTGGPPGPRSTWLGAPSEEAT